MRIMSVLKEDMPICIRLFYTKNKHLLEAVAHSAATKIFKKSSYGIKLREKRNAK